MICRDEVKNCILNKILSYPVQWTYINRDMTKEEAKAAFDKRQARRVRSSNLTKETPSNTKLSAAAPSFNPPSSFNSGVPSGVPTPLVTVMAVSAGSPQATGSNPVLPASGELAAHPST